FVYLLTRALFRRGVFGQSLLISCFSNVDICSLNNPFLHAEIHSWTSRLGHSAKMRTAIYDRISTNLAPVIESRLVLILALKRPGTTVKPLILSTNLTKSEMWLRKSLLAVDCTSSKPRS